ncbi:DUF3137 domain-containing protein [Flammeovirga aprica]|uniref:DUF3137 domain-containing protein n=1 Tax=Flammeovirga aprica JL-4 TaxID=694437 RepID=A0A7X9XCZ1_9BACT|nr:DUF3137 domain-containing protein [Flammeovirga aprica]NME72238.1 DUF3137 domain-containing protein [Flammeovirga aprica JL-4]
MISQNELSGFYKEKLEPQLDGLEKQRKVVRNLNTGKISFFIFTLLVHFANSLELLALESVKYLEHIMYSILILVNFSLFIINYIKKRDYRSEYKSKVVQSVVNLIDENWDYYPDDKISESQYKGSILFPARTDSYNGDDLIKGRIGQTDFQCSELHTQYKKVSGSGKNRKTTWYTIFKGLFFHADFNKHFSGITFVRTRNLSRHHSQSFGPVDLEDPEFSKRFHVHSTDQVEARYILTPKIMEAFITLYNYYSNPIDVSFVDSRVNCAVSFKEDLFEPPVYKTIFDLEAVQKVYALLYFNQVVIDELNLNVRIWTKGVNY